MSVVKVNLSSNHSLVCEIEARRIISITKSASHEMLTLCSAIYSIMYKIILLMTYTKSRIGCLEPTECFCNLVAILINFSNIKRNTKNGIEIRRAI